MKKVARVFNQKYFKIIVLIVTLPMLIPIVHASWGSFVKISLVFGIIVIVVDFLTKKKFLALKNRVNLCLLLFSVSYLVTIILNRGSCFSQNISQLAYMIVFFLLLFMIEDSEECDIKKELKTISWIIIIASIFISLLYVFSNSENFSPNPNVGGQIAALSIALTVGVLICNREKIISILMLLNICFQSYVLIISSSRGSIVSLIMSLLFLAVVYLFKHYRDKKSNNAIYSAPITMAMFTENMLSESDKFVQLTTGRSLLWLAGLASFLDAPIFGLTREGSVLSILNNVGYLNDGSIHYNRSLVGGVHNGYLTVLISSGIVGFIIILLAFGFVAYELFYVVRRKKVLSDELIIALFISVFFLLTEIVENRILYQVTAFNAMFWIYFGYLYYFVHKEYVTLKGII